MNVVSISNLKIQSPQPQNAKVQRDGSFSVEGETMYQCAAKRHARTKKNPTLRRKDMLHCQT